MKKKKTKSFALDLFINIIQHVVYSMKRVEETPPLSMVLSSSSLLTFAEYPNAL